LSFHSILMELRLSLIDITYFAIVQSETLYGLYIANGWLQRSSIFSFIVMMIKIFLYEIGTSSAHLCPEPLYLLVLGCVLELGLRASSKTRWHRHVPKSQKPSYDMLSGLPFLYWRISLLRPIVNARDMCQEAYWRQMAQWGIFVAYASKACLSCLARNSNWSTVLYHYSC
jgi:hypothetical protein